MYSIAYRMKKGNKVSKIDFIDFNSYEELEKFSKEPGTIIINIYHEGVK